MSMADILKKAYRKLRLQLKRGENYFSYFDNPRENLSMCNLNLDIRNPEKGRKYISVGNDSSVNGTAVFESEGGALKYRKQSVLRRCDIYFSQ